MKIYLEAGAFSENTGVTREFELKMHIRNAESIIMQPPESEWMTSSLLHVLSESAHSTKQWCSLNR